MIGIDMNDIKAFDLNLLKALDALLDERSVTRAAVRLGLTQPAMSAILTRLRDIFGDALFVRNPRGITPTLRALELAAPVKEVLGGAQRLLKPATFDPATAEMTFSLAATDYALQAIVVPFLVHLRTRAPGIRVAIRPMEEDSVQGQFERGDLDLALSTPGSAHPGQYSRRLFEETYVCAMGARHPHARDTPLSLETFCALDHALVSYSGERFRGVTDDALARIGRERRIVLTVTSFLVLAEILRTTDIIAIVPRRLAAGSEGLVIVDPPIEVPGFTKVALWHERTHRNAAHRWIRALLFSAQKNGPITEAV